MKRLLPWLAVLCLGVAAAVVFWHRPEVAPVVEQSSGPATFARDVAPIIFAKCSPCHHPGEAAPFSLLTFDDVRRRASQIVEVTHKGFMPPWLPAEGQGDFADARRLTAKELQTIKEWVDLGTPLGEEASLPVSPVFTDGWQAGAPDLVLESPAYTLPAAGKDVFRNFVVPVKLDGPRWVQSIELRAVNSRVTHHARLGVDATHESVRRDAEDPEPGYDGMAWGQDPDGQMVIWAPGMVTRTSTPGVAWRIYPQTILVLHSHLQPSGKPEVVKFRIGLRFAAEPPTTRPVMLRIGSCSIDIPAGARRHVVTDEYTLPIDVDVATIFPHAHSLCKELHVVAERPDGVRLPLVSIPHFDENWHEVYRYRAPVRLPRGTRLLSTFAYDNTEGNTRNRNRPPRRVAYGSNASDEMADVYLQVTPVRAVQRAVLMEHYRQYDLQSQVDGCRKSLDLDPGNLWSQEALAASRLGLGQPAEAIAILEQRLKAGPAAVFPVTSLGMARLANREPAQAEAELRRALTMDAEYPLAWLGLGNALAAQKKTEAAEQAYRKAATLAPDLVEARLNLADLLLNRGELDEAARVCTAALVDSPDLANVLLKLAEISAKRKNYVASLDYCQQARRAGPYTHPAKVLLAVFCLADGDATRGVALLQEARTEEPSHPVASLLLGQLARQRQDGLAARSYLAAAASLPVPDTWPASHRQRFLVLLHSERYQLAKLLKDDTLARESLTHWQQLEPGNPQVKKLLDELP